MGPARLNRPTVSPGRAARSAAHLNRAAQLVDAVGPDANLDAVLQRRLAPRRDLDPDDRRALSRAVAAFFRWRLWLPAREPLPRQIAAALELQARFDADPDAIKSEALAARAVPAWIWPELPLAPGAPEGAAWLRQLQREPARWIRVREPAAGATPSAPGDCLPAPPLKVAGLPPRLRTAFRHTGSRDLYLTGEFQGGRFEIQDLASQLVGIACAPRPGETWWDACAGEGGKTLHLAELMGNRGLIWASDRSRRRLEQLKRRAARAGVFNYRVAFWDGGARPPTRTRFDGVLVDAPCSGVGTWQRHPDARWTTSPADVRELAGVQQRLLDHVAPALKPGGRLVYAVCTLTHSETVRVAERFLAAHPEFEPAAVFPEVGGRKPEVRSHRSETGAQGSAVRGVPLENPPSPTSDLRPPTSILLRPQDLDANGMFIAAWRKTA